MLALDSASRVTVKIKRRFLARQERVFDAWLDRRNAGKWLFATRNGTMVKMVIEPMVGGKFCFFERRGGEDVEHIGEYLEIDRPRRLVFSFCAPKYSTEPTVVSISIESLTNGCELELTHEGVYAEYVQATETGWAIILAGLASTLG